MAQVPKTKGPIKLSETALDKELYSAAMPSNSDGASVIERLSVFAGDAAIAQDRVVVSTGQVTWNGTLKYLFIPTGTTLQIFLMMDSASSPDGNGLVRLHYTGVANEVIGSVAPSALGTRIAIDDNHALFVNLDRALLDSSFDIELDINPVSGHNLTVISFADTPHVNASPDSAGVDSLLLGVAAAEDVADDALQTKLTWLPSGISWQAEITTANVGSVPRGASIPIGSIIAWHYPLYTSSPSQAIVSAIAPNFWLCDGSVINDSDSPYNGLNSFDLSNYAYLIGRDRADGSFVGENSVNITSDYMGRHRHTAFTSFNVETASQLNMGWTGPDYRPDNPGITTVYRIPGSANMYNRNLALTRRDYSALSGLAHHHQGQFTTAHPAQAPSVLHDNMPKSFRVIYIMRIK